MDKNSKNLLDLLVCDEKKINKKLYSGGPYWNYKCKKIYDELLKKNLYGFRGLYSGVGTSYADNIVLDIRNELGKKGKFASFFLKGNLNPLNKIFINQVKNNISHIENYLKYKSLTYTRSEKVIRLTTTYNFENTTEFHCVDKVKINNKDISTLYIEIANDIEFINKHHDLKKISSFFEIGGGFGSKIHFLLTNFKNIKKIIYLDIVPNIFVGTNYLKNFYGSKVIDYATTRNLKSIKFSDNDNLEIFSLPVWEIEKLDLTIDYFHNSHSFQEVPIHQIKNYYKFLKNFMKNNTKISLISYLSGTLPKKIDDKNVMLSHYETLDPKIINQVFGSILSEHFFENSISTTSNVCYLN